jgi:fimbrial chaperone protein
MIFSRLIFTIAWLLALAAIAPASAGTISVSPVLLDVVTQNDAATSLTIANKGAAPANVQIRIFSWKQVSGRDVLEPTTDVVISPPMVRLAPGAEQLVRAVRLSKKPVQGEEAYRLLVDELPSRPRGEATSVSLVVRQSIPLFFRSPSAITRQLIFSVRRDQKSTDLTGQNTGEIRQRVTELKVLDQTGALNFSRPGLAGYVLGKSSYFWSVPKLSPGPKTISFKSDSGTLRLPAQQR